MHILLAMPPHNAVIRILLADDHAIVRDGLRHIMSDTQDIAIVGEASTGAEVLAMAKSLDFDLLLLDMNMPDPSGIDLVHRLLANDATLKILVLSMHSEPHLVSRVLRAGVHGYITKGSGQALLTAAIRKVAAGGHFIDPSLVDEFVFNNGASSSTSGISPHEKLSDRELQVLRMLAEGQSLTDIAQSLHLSDKTISAHKARLMQKLSIHSNAGLVRYAVRHGLVSE
ncbi:MAG: response regulator transcription factor [Sulfuricellaceae bacterium]